MPSRSAFWDDHERRMRDPDYRLQFVLESRRLAAIDSIVNQLDELREEQGLSKAELARAIERHPAAVRRFLTAQQSNPSFSMLSDLATALGYQIVLRPMSEEDRGVVADSVHQLTHRAS